MINSPLAELLAYTRMHAGPAATRQAGFILAYFEKTDPDEMAARGSATLFAIADAHWRLLDAPLGAQSAKVRVFNPTLAEDGFVSEHTVVQIVHDNMPFLVDSVTMAINRGSRTAHWIVHPLMSVARDEKGKIVTVTSAAAAAETGQDDPIESLILVECDRIVDSAEQKVLAQELGRVLSDVRSAVQDWRVMLERVQSVGAACQNSRLSPESQQEGIEFLQWLQDRHFTFLGARDYDLKREGNTVSLVARADSGLGILRGAVQTAETRLPPGSNFTDRIK